MQKALGGKIAFGIGEEIIVDTPALMNKLPAGTFTAVLLQKTAIPHKARRQLQFCDLWKAV